MEHECCELVQVLKGTVFCQQWVSQNNKQAFFACFHIIHDKIIIQSKYGTEVKNGVFIYIIVRYTMV